MSPAQLAKMLNFPELPHYYEQIEQRLIDMVSNMNPLIKEPIMRHIKGVNKRYPMGFLLSIIKSQGGKIDERVIAICAAFVQQQFALYIHDDITDHSDMRYGIPTTNAVEGDNQAILIGDYLFNNVIQEALSIDSEMAKVFVDSLAENRESEIIEDADRYNVERSIDSYLNCIKLKTTWFPATCRVGSLFAGLTAPPDNIIREIW